jgi:hypothetical protein
MTPQADRTCPSAGGCLPSQLLEQLAAGQNLPRKFTGLACALDSLGRSRRSCADERLGDGDHVVAARRIFSTLGDAAGYGESENGADRKLARERAPRDIVFSSSGGLRHPDGDDALCRTSAFRLLRAVGGSRTQGLAAESP